MAVRRLLSLLFITGLTFLNIQSIQAQEETVGKVPAPAPAPAAAEPAEALDTCSLIAARYESPAEQEQALKCCENYTMFTNDASRSLVNRLDVNISRYTPIADLVDCCVKGTITAEPQSAEDVTTARLSCSCQRNPLNTACFSCFGKAHQLDKIDECHDDFSFVYDDESNTASVLNCYDSPAKTADPDIIESYLKDEINDGEQFCHDSRAEYLPETHQCCTRSKEIALCGCDNPQNVGTAYCGQHEVKETEENRLTKNIALDREIASKYYRVKQVERDINLWGYVQCLYPEQVDHWKKLGINISANELGGYTLNIQAPESACQRLQSMIDGSYDPNAVQETALVDARKEVLLTENREPKECLIQFPACECSEPTEPETTPEPEPDDPIIIDEPPVNPQTAQICFGMADGNKVVCDGTEGMVETNRELVADLMSMPVFPSELGNEENWAQYQELITIWEDLHADRITVAEARQRMTVPARFLAERWVEHKTANLIVKSLRMQQNSVIDGTATATLGSLSREEVVIATNANNSKSVYIQKNPDNIYEQNFSTALNSNLSEGKVDYIVLPVMSVKLKGGACGASLTGTGPVTGSHSALLWLLLMTFLALSTVQRFSKTRE